MPDVALALLLASLTFSYRGACIALIARRPTAYRENGVLVRDTYAPAWNVVDGHEECEEVGQ